MSVVAPPSALPPPRATWRHRLRARRAAAARGVTVRGLPLLGTGVVLDVTGGGRLTFEDGCVVMDGCRFHVRGGAVTVGAGAVLGERCAVVCHHRVDIGAGAVLADGTPVVDVAPGHADAETPVRLQPLTTRAVVVPPAARWSAASPDVRWGLGRPAPGAPAETTRVTETLDLLPCSERAEALGEDMAGTAPSERGVLVVEQSGPWGRDAVAESGLRPVADALGARAKALGLRVQVVRKSTRRYAPEGCAAWIADFGARTLERFPSVAAEDLPAVAPGAGERVAGPMLLCCTHSTRDPCCARRGLPLHRALCVTGVDTWHASHLGGHRFAATMAALPLGVWLGRVPAEDAARVVALLREERLPLEYVRGRAGHPPAVQAAEVAVRRHADLDGIDDLALGAVDGERVTFTTRDGQTLAADVRHAPTGRVRGVSCGADAKQEDPGRFEVTLVPR